MNVIPPIKISIGKVSANNPTKPNTENKSPELSKYMLSMPFINAVIIHVGSNTKNNKLPNFEYFFEKYVKKSKSQANYNDPNSITNH